MTDEGFSADARATEEGNQQASNHEDSEADLRELVSQMAEQLSGFQRKVENKFSDFGKQFAKIRYPKDEGGDSKGAPDAGKSQEAPDYSEIEQRNEFRMRYDKLPDEFKAELQRDIDNDVSPGQLLRQIELLEKFGGGARTQKRQDVGPGIAGRASHKTATGGLPQTKAEFKEMWRDPKKKQNLIKAMSDTSFDWRSLPDS